MDAAFGDAAAGGGPAVAPVPAALAVPQEDDQLLFDEDGQGWTDRATTHLLDTAVLLLRYALQTGEVRFNRLDFWREVSRSLKQDKQLNASSHACQIRYKAVMSYYRRSRGLYRGKNYKFASKLEEVIPMDDVLKPAQIPTKKRNKPAKSAADDEGSSSKSAAAGSAEADRTVELLQLVRQLNAEARERDARDAAWQATTQAALDRQSAELQQLRDLHLQNQNAWHWQHGVFDTHDSSGEFQFQMDQLFPGGTESDAIPPSNQYQ